MSSTTHSLPFMLDWILFAKAWKQFYVKLKEVIDDINEVKPDSLQDQDAVEKLSVQEL